MKDRVLAICLVFSIIACILYPRIPTFYDLYMACSNGDCKKVNKMLDEPKFRKHVFLYAIQFGHVDLVRMLLADPRVKPENDRDIAIEWAVTYGHVEVVKLLLQDQRTVSETPIADIMGAFFLQPNNLTLRAKKQEFEELVAQ